MKNNTQEKKIPCATKNTLKNRTYYTNLRNKKLINSYLFIILLLLSNIGNAGIENTLNQDAQIVPKFEQSETPKGLSQEDWQDVKAKINQNHYKAHKQSNGHFLSRNIAQKWSINYAKNGLTHISSLSKADKYSIGLKLKSIGYHAKSVFKEPENIVANKDKLIYQWSDDIQEIWINSPNSLEQWFEIKHKPAGSKIGHDLQITMQLDSSLNVTQTNQSLNFANKISYDKLKVWDSLQQSIPAKMQLQDNQLTLLIDDTKAIYPLTIDPSFQQQAYIKAFNAGVDDSFGFSVAISGDYMVVGAMDEESGTGNPFSNNALQAGAAYVFERDSDGQWTFQTYLKASDIDAGDRFGFSVAISGDTLVIGATGEDSNATGVNNDDSDNSETNSGAAYVFVRNSNTGVWSQQAYLKASNPDGGLGGGTLGDNFGTSVAISGNRIIVGAPAEDSNATGVDGNDLNNSSSNSGAAYVFVRANDVWSQQAYLKASNTGASDRFGSAVAISGQAAIVGAPNEDSNSTGVGGNEANNSASSAGAAYVFTNRNALGGEWRQEAYLKASNTGNGDLFGGSVSIDGNSLVVSATSEDSASMGVNGGENNNDASSSGAVYIFTGSPASPGNFSDLDWDQTVYLKASNTQAGDAFGTSVALSDRILVVGAKSEDGISTGIDGDENFDLFNGNSGSAYVFRLNTSNVWSQVSYLKSSNSEGNDNFGQSVAVSDESIVVGANNEDGDESQVDNNNTLDSGAAYVFTSTESIWTQQRITKASNIDVGDRFGQAVAMSSSTLVIGAFKEDSGSFGVDGDEDDNTRNDAGAVYVFTRNNSGSWVQQAYLKASNPDANDWFGYSVAISGDTIVVGARNESSNATGVNGDENNNLSNDAGAVYVFTRSNNIWSQQAYIKPSNTGAGDFFGFTVAVSQDTLAVGAVFEDSNAIGIDGDDNNDSAIHSGAAYIFVREDLDNWSQQSYIKASNTDASDEFGRTVSLSGDTLIVSANREDSDSSGIGASNNNNGNDTGAVYVFARENGTWQQEAFVKALNAGNNDEFGRSIALSPSGFTFVVGARNEDSNSPFSPNDNSLSNSGAVYGFRKALGTWSSFGYIKAPNLDGGDWFGDWLAMSDDDTIVVGASREDSQSKNNNSGENDNSLNNSGAAYVFTSDIIGNWSLQTYLKAANSGDTDGFGSTVAISENALVVGASLEDSSTGFSDNDSAVDSGAIYIYNTSDVIFENGFE